MIYDFRILPFALGDVIISMIHGSVALRDQKSKFPFYYYRYDLEKDHPIQGFINKRNAKKHLGDLNEALLFNPLRLPVKRITKTSENAGCETTQDLTIQNFYQDYVESNRVNEYHNYFNINIASHRSLNMWSDKNNQIPQLKSPSVIIRNTKNLIKRYTGKKKWICVHLRFRGLENNKDLADVNRNADPRFWHQILSEIAQQYKNDHAILLLGPAGSYPIEFYKISNLYAVSIMGGTLKNSIAAILSASAFIGSSSGFANCATFSSTPYLIFDVSDNGYENYCIEKDSIRLPFAKKQQHLSSQSESKEILAKKLRTLLPRLKKQKPICLKDSEVKKATNKYAKNKVFSHIISKLVDKLNDKPDRQLFSEIVLLENVVPDLKEDPCLKMLKSSSLLGFHASSDQTEAYFKKIQDLTLKSGISKNNQILQNKKIEISTAIALYEKNWNSFSKDLDIRATRNLLSKLNCLGFQVINRMVFRILFYFWKYWYRAFYKPFGRYRI